MLNIKNTLLVLVLVLAAPVTPTAPTIKPSDKALTNTTDYTAAHSVTTPAAYKSTMTVP